MKSPVPKILAAAAIAATSIAVAAPAGAAPAPASSSVTPGASLQEAAGAPAVPATPAPAPVEQGTTLAPPAAAAPTPSPSSGGVAPHPAGGEGSAEEAAPPAETPAGALPAPDPSEALAIPSLPASSCAATGVPPILVPIYQRAAEAYNLGPQGPAVLAGINEIETAFGTNTNVSSAGAQGWMQFMPETWAGYGVDANGDGVKDPYNPEDAIFAAANYLSASGMPADTYGAIFAYNHADWYVAEVLSNAGCYGSLNGGADVFSLKPQMTVLTCKAAPDWRKQIPAEYMAAFEDAASRYELGRRGVWALAAVARLESNFGQGMSKKQLRATGPLGLDAAEWKAYAVDGDGDGHLRHASPADSAATLARLIWARGSLEAGLFSHNQAEWYVQAVLAEADRIEGGCKAESVAWDVVLPGVTGTPINWANLTLSNELELHDITSGAIDPRIMALIAAITQHHQLTLSALRSDHSELTAEGGVSNHFYGRAMDIAAVDGVSCTDTAPSAPCAQLGYALAQMSPPLHPTELIFCFDLDGPGPAFARADHCNHVHAGYDG